MEEKKPIYTLTLSSEQIKAVRDAVELMMRLKINQPEEIPRAVLNWGEGLEVDEWCRRRDEAEPYLYLGFKALFPTWQDVKKDTLWHRLYDLYQVTRYAIHEAEHPASQGVDSYKPMCTASEPMAKCEWRKEE